MTKQVQPRMYRQGDVLLVAIDKIPAEARPVPSVGSLIVLAYGEATGHAHVMDAGRTEEFRTEHPVPTHNWHAERFLRVLIDAPLRHEKAGQLTLEHNTLQVLAGDYALLPQREYTPQALRRVTD